MMLDDNNFENINHNIENRNKNIKNNNKSNIIKFIQSKLFISLLIIITLFIILICISFVISYEKENDVTHSIEALNDNLSEEQKFWFNDGLDELKDALKVQLNKKRAKNIIFFVADGMGPTTTTASRIYKYGEEGKLLWENFPNMGILKTYCMDRQVPDSFSTATALFGGVKTNYETGGVDASVHLNDCLSSKDEKHHINSIIKWGQDYGMSTGFVTTTRVTHATPAALYSHTPDRRWECESTMSEENKLNGCKDIGRQLIEDLPGRNINVILGGGRQCLISNVNETATDPIDLWSCQSKDGRNLINDWKLEKKQRNLKYAYAENTNDIRQLNINNVDYLLGIFANGHLNFDHFRDKSPNGTPSLAEMTEVAIKVLSKNVNKGFILVVESGLIDQAHHRGNAKQALNEVIVMEEAVNVTLNLMKSNLDETLIIVTSDHAHTLSINGYPKRGSSILGVAQNSKFDFVPYTTLSYATGHFGYQTELNNDGIPQRKDPSKEDTTDFNYIQQVAIKTDENTHGGTDVQIYAMGPMSHLFHKLHEQSYVAHVISYAARIGRFRDNNIITKILEKIGIT